MCNFRESSTGTDVEIEYWLLNLETNEISNLYVEALGFDFDYPYLVYHYWNGATTAPLCDLYILDVTTNTTKTINHASWGQIDGEYVTYIYENGYVNEAHIYHIPTQNDHKAMESSGTAIEIETYRNEFLILITTDTGPTANTEIFTYNIASKSAEKKAEHPDWMIYHEFTGDYIFWSKGGGGDAIINVFNINTEKNQEIIGNQWIASLATGTLSAEGKIVTWASDYQIHMTQIEA